MPKEADTVIILSSELIAEVMEVHFNKQMFKQQVKIVELKPTETGYAFSLLFTPKPIVAEVKPTTVEMTTESFPQSSVNKIGRAHV